MINNVTQIASPYTKTATKVNDSSTLNASEWNAISNAVETAHAKINSVINSGTVSSVTGTTVSVSGQIAGISGTDELNITGETTGITGKAIDITSTNENNSAITIENTKDDSEINLKSGDIQFRINNHIV